jgi:hypothetical protein
MRIVRFLQKATTDPEYKTTWNTLVTRGLQRPKPAKGKPEEGNGDEVLAIRKGGRNTFYEDILRLPQNERGFIRYYFAYVPDLHPAKDTQPIPSNVMSQYAAHIIPWSFIDLFLQEVMLMEKKRIAAIKELGDRLAAYVNEFDDKRFFSKFYQVQQSYLFWNEILRANKNATLHGKAPLFPYDSFCTIFFTPDGDDDLRFDWKLARDLTFIRMLEWLSEHDDKLSDHIQALQERGSDIDTTIAKDEQE